MLLGCTARRALLLLGLVACGGAEDALDDVSSSTAANTGASTIETPTEPASPADAPPAVLEASATSTLSALTTDWSGTLPATSWVSYGSSACWYRMRFENVRIDATIDGDDRVVAATVKATFVEEPIQGCTATPIPRGQHAYSYVAPAAADATAFRVRGATGNNPAADVVVDIATQSATSGRATLRWSRTGVPAPFDWVTAAEQVTLKKI